MAQFWHVQDWLGALNLLFINRVTKFAAATANKTQYCFVMVGKLLALSSGVFRIAVCKSMTVQFDKFNGDLKSASAPFGVVAVSNRPGLYRNVFKRLLDIAAILISLPFSLPVIGCLAIGVALGGHRPFYRSSRVGRGGRNFKMLKLQTMVPDGDAILAEHLANNPDAQFEWDTTQKLRDDPRVTPFGRFLRKTSLDELPQVWNVLIGDMSLVGPRPMLPTQRVLYPGMAYYMVRPGITGPWQVSERNESEFTKRAEHDADYDENLSFVADVTYLARTVKVVVKGTGY